MGKYISEFYRLFNLYLKNNVFLSLLSRKKNQRREIIYSILLDTCTKTEYTKDLDVM